MTIFKQGLSFTFVFLILASAFIAQVPPASPANSITIRVTGESGPIRDARVTVRGLDLSAVTDDQGNAVLREIPDGDQFFDVVAEGFRLAEVAASFPNDSGSVKEVELEENESEVTVSTTRTGREIENTPTRVEAIDEEEIDEKSSMRSSNVSMILNESTGIKVQQTSATTFSQSIRIQGLDGRYTQILKDGFPAFGGFSGSIGLLDILPLDLKQVEIVKGASSTFYGGGAIAGVVNFVSKEPEERPVTSMIINQTSALGTDVSAFHSRRAGRFATTLLGAFSFQRSYDADGDGFTELPSTRSASVAPRFFLAVNDKTKIVIGNSTTVQTRLGGDLSAIRDDVPGRYVETHRSARNITTFQFERDFASGAKLFAKQSISYFDRSNRTPGYEFSGRQINSFSEASVFLPVGKHLIVFGANAVYDDFNERHGPAELRNESQTSFGGFVQDTFEINSRISVEAGFRLDSVRGSGVFALPRVSLLFRITERLSGRFTVGLGYKSPTIFTEQAETLLFRNIVPLGSDLKAETSRGGTFDLNYKRTIGERFSISINQMFFFTEISDPIELFPIGNNRFRFANAPAVVSTRGTETNLRISYGIVNLFAGHTYTDARAGYLPGDSRLPLTPKNKLNSALLLEKENSFKAGIEAYFTGPQVLSDRSRTPSFWVLGIFGERTFGRISVFFNAENITDTRQSRFSPVVLPPLSNPTFAEIFTHTEGRIFNGGLKLRF